MPHAVTFNEACHITNSTLAATQGCREVVVVGGGRGGSQFTTVPDNFYNVFCFSQMLVYAGWKINDAPFTPRAIFKQF